MWHSGLTTDQITSLERFQKTCLRVILGDNYVSYSSALEMCILVTLFERREERCLSFVSKCLKHPLHKRIYPLNENNADNQHISREKYMVNFARTDAYRISAIP
jgi:hypothetical protein